MPAHPALCASTPDPLADDPHPIPADLQIVLDELREMFADCPPMADEELFSDGDVACKISTPDHLAGTPQTLAETRAAPIPAVCSPLTPSSTTHPTETTTTIAEPKARRNHPSTTNSTTKRTSTPTTRSPSTSRNKPATPTTSAAIVVPDWFVPSSPRRHYHGTSPLLRQAVKESEDRRIREEYEEAQRRAGRENLRRLYAPANQNVRPHRYLSEKEKVDTSLEALEATRTAYAFRSTFSRKKEAELRQAAQDGRDILQIIADAITRQFRRRNLPVPAFGFVIEEAPKTNRLHIHGAYPVDGSIPLEAIRDCFVDAAGRIPGKAGGSQFWHAPAYTLPHYFEYSRKDEDRVMRRLGLSRVTFINDKLRRLGREAYEAKRKPTAKAPIVITATTEEEIERLLAELDDLEIPGATPIIEVEHQPVEVDLDRPVEVDMRPAVTSQTTSKPTLRPFFTLPVAALTIGQEGTAGTRQHFPPLYTFRPLDRAHSRARSHQSPREPRSTSPPSQGRV